VQLVLGDHPGDGVRGRELHLRAHLERALEDARDGSTLLIWLG
jgi:hypothetical protein